MRKLETTKVDFRTFALIVSAHPYCALIFIPHVTHESSGKALKCTMIEQMVIAISLPGFKDLGRSADNISLQRSNCNILWLADALHWLYSLMKLFFRSRMFFNPGMLFFIFYHLL